MSTVFALTTLYNEIQAMFIREGTTANMSFGVREPPKQLNQGFGRANRIVFEPGAAGKLGEYAAARRPGRNPKPLMTLLEKATIYVWGFDINAPNDEMAQYEVCRLTHDAIIRAIIISAKKTDQYYTISDPEWIFDKTERLFGYELKFVLTVGSMIPDHEWVETSPTVPRETDIMVFPSGDVTPNTP